MDIDEVSGIPQYVQLLEKQKGLLKAAGKRKGEVPSDSKSLRQLVNDFMIQYMGRQLFMTSQNQHEIHSSFVPPPYQPSVAPLTELKKITLKDLRLETHHRGSYLLLRSATPGLRRTAIMAVMEDQDANGVTFQLYQQPDDEHRTAENILPEKTVWIVKEPYFKVMGDGGYGIRVDHISDIVQVAGHDWRVPAAWRPRITELERTSSSLKEDGNRALKAGKLYEAVALYTQAISEATDSQQRRVIQLNRSLANLRLGAYDQALEDAGYPIFASGDSEKGLYRAARALYELGRFGESADGFRSMLDRFPHSAEAHTELARTNHRLREIEFGIYDFKAMHAAAKMSPPKADCATYVGPLVQKHSDGKGRGLFTTKDVLAGELLLCEKAFVYSWADTENKAHRSRTSVLMNTSTNQITMGTQASLITEVVQKIHRIPSAMADVTLLHRGDFEMVQATQVDGLPVIDTFLMERIISLNSFGCPRTSLEVHLERSTRIEDLKKDNAFHSCGLFINASFINHSCYGNVRRSFIADMQIVRATCNIPADTEITFPYIVPDPSASYADIQKKLQQWGFECTCSICNDRKTTRRQTMTQRRGLLQNLEEAFSARSGPDLAKAARLLAALEKTYSAPASAVPRLALWDPYLLLTRLHTANGHPEEVVQTALKVLSSLGFKLVRQNPVGPNSSFYVEQWGLMVEHVVETWLHLWVAYAQLAPELCEEAERCARISYKICVGEDETFSETYGKMARQAISKEKDLVQLLQEMKL